MDLLAVVAAFTDGADLHTHVKAATFGKRGITDTRRDAFYGDLDGEVESAEWHTRQCGGRHRSSRYLETLVGKDDFLYRHIGTLRVQRSTRVFDNSGAQKFPLQNHRRVILGL